MDRKSITVAVTFIVLAFAWMAIYQKMYPPRPMPVAPPAPAISTTQTAATNAGAVTAETPPSAPATAQESAPAAPRKESGPRPPEQETVLENALERVVFTTYGGGIKRIELKKYKVSRGQPQPVVINRFGKLPMGDTAGVGGFDEDTVFDVKQDGQTMSFEARNADGVRLTKQFRLGDGYRIDGEFAVANGGKQPLKDARLQFCLGTASAVVPADKFEMPSVDWSTGERFQMTGSSAFNAGGIGPWSHPGRDVVSFDNVHPAWAGVEDRFFCALWMPKVTTGSVSAVRIPVQQPDYEAGHARRPSDYGIVGTLSSPTFGLAAGESYQYPFQMYAGPKEYTRLQNLGRNQTEVMQWTMWGMSVEWIAELLLKSMKLLYRMVPNYFFVIILTTIVLKLIFWPLTAMSNRSMKAMQALSPKLTVLREKYKEEPQKLNAEMMKLYKEHKVNPMAGCLPTVVQIPVFFGFYYMLRSAVELRGHGFLWIHDFAQPDSVAQIGTFFINPLPILMGATMIWQMKTTPSTGDPSQQKMMMFMPLMFLFFCYGMPSGLVLYWTVQNIFTVVQMRMTKHTLAPASAGSSKSSTPTKAKGK